LIWGLESKHIPIALSSTKRRHKPIWMTNKVQKLLTKNRRTFSKYRSNTHPAYKNTNKEASTAVKKAKKSFEKMLARNIKADKKSFFAYVRSKTKCKVRTGPLLNNCGEAIRPQETVDTFNQYFCTVFTKKDLNSAPMYMSNTVPLFGINDIQITEDMVKKKLSVLQQDKAGGPDNLLPRLLMQIQNEISHPPWILFQKSLQEGAVPDDSKRANVAPIFQKSSRGLPENYRPVSLTSQCSKLLEAIIRDSLTDCLESNCSITDSQHEFRTGRLCMSNLMSFLDRVSEGVDDFEFSGFSVSIKLLTRTISSTQRYS